MPVPAAPAHRARACVLLPQPPRGAFDLERLHGKDVHGSFHLPPRPGVRHDEPGQGLRHRASDFLRTEEHLHPLHVRRAPPTLNAATQSCPQTHTHRKKNFKKRKEKARRKGEQNQNPAASHQLPGYNAFLGQLDAGQGIYGDTVPKTVSVFT